MGEMWLLAAALTTASPGPSLAPAEAAAAGKQAVAILTSYAQSGDPETRSLAAASWGEIGNTTAVPLLKRALRDKNIGVRIAAAGSLHQLGENDAAAQALTAIIRKRPAAGGGPEQQMRRLARDQARAKAIALLSQFGGEEAVELFEEMLKDPSAAVREATSLALARMGLDEFGNPFIEAAHDKDDAEVRATAVRALGEIGLAEYFAAVRDAMADASADVRLEAAGALAVFKGREAAAALELGMQDEDARVRAKALAGLAKFMDLDSLETLRAVRNEAKTTEVALKADAGLALRGDPVELGLAERTLRAKDPDLKLLALDVLRVSPLDEATMLLKRLMDEEREPRIRMLAATAIVKRTQRRRS